MQIKDLKRAFMGGSRVPTGDAIGVTLRITQVIVDEGHRVAQLEGTYEFFVDPPSINVTGTLHAELRLEAAEIEIESDSGQFKLVGRVVGEPQAILGKADYPNFNLMGVSGDFLAQDIELEAFDDEEDE